MLLSLTLSFFLEMYFLIHLFEASIWLFCNLAFTFVDFFSKKLNKCSIVLNCSQEKTFVIKISLSRARIFQPSKMTLCVQIERAEISLGLDSRLSHLGKRISDDPNLNASQFLCAVSFSFSLCCHFLFARFTRKHLKFYFHSFCLYVFSLAEQEILW